MWTGRAGNSVDTAVVTVICCFKLRELGTDRWTFNVSENLLSEALTVPPLKNRDGLKDLCRENFVAILPIFLLPVYSAVLGLL